MIRDPFYVDSRFIGQLIDPIGARKRCLLVLTKVESSVLLFLVLIPVRVDSIHLNSQVQVLCPPSFMYFFSFFNNIYNHLTYVGLE